MEHTHYHHHHQRLKNKLGCIGLIILFVGIIVLLFITENDGALNWFKSLMH